ncbi:DUF2947 family protein [Flavobacterium sp. LC2016-01]|uniref:DUF2947 family protein n=1 Tax=Flavobacterium sp. LC2016-01 TaxID=2675876 RepID=UPI0012BAF394|nr:DUF2947 family protein [Flavobacterium sp. LC2016-01]MTH13988.1 DUF2947 family protein [Flavobacterium sp. LC2016-01]
MEKSINKYEALEKFYYFEKEYCYPVLTVTDKPQIKALTDHYCSQLWNEYVSETKHHLMLVNDLKDWKIKNEIKKEYNWQKDWNNNIIEAFEENIKPLLDWKDEDPVFFFWNKFSGIETTWSLICKYWISFLYEDEANILVSPKSKNVIILSVNGNLTIAERE